MTNEQSYFLQILSDHLNGRKSTANETIDWSVVLTFAQNHQVNGIVYYQCKRFLPDEVKKKPEKKYGSELFYYYRRLELYEQVKNALSAAQIPFFTVKGLTVAQFYPFPALRTMGDCDIVVHTEDKEKAHAVLMELGFENEAKGGNEWVYFKDKLEFELHDHLLYEEFGNTIASRRLTDSDAWEKATPAGAGTCCELDWSFHFLFLLLHLKKHFIHYGVGFRQFMDLSVMLQHCDLDWTWLKDTLEGLSLWRFLLVCLALIERWFGTTAPIEPEQIDEAFYQEATDKIFANGVFGFDDEANIENKTTNGILWHRGPLWLARLKVLIGNVFPSYRNMRYVPYYTFVNQRPWLLPVAWVYRFIRSIRFRMASRGKIMLSEALLSSEKIDGRKEALAKWGL